LVSVYIALKCYVNMAYIVSCGTRLS